MRSKHLLLSYERPVWGRSSILAISMRRYSVEVGVVVERLGRPPKELLWKVSRCQCTVDLKRALE